MAKQIISFSSENITASVCSSSNSSNSRIVPLSLPVSSANPAGQGSVSKVHSSDSGYSNITGNAATVPGDVCCVCLSKGAGCNKAHNFHIGTEKEVSEQEMMLCIFPLRHLDLTRMSAQFCIHRTQ